VLRGLNALSYRRTPSRQDVDDALADVHQC
jgi:hypothetical protein